MKDSLDKDLSVGDICICSSDMFVNSNYAELVHYIGMVKEIKEGLGVHVVCIKAPVEGHVFFEYFITSSLNITKL